MRITIRPARPEDLEFITTWTENTFDWGDYVSRLYDGWLEDPRGLVSVALNDEGKQIGLSRVVMLSATEAWFHAARVHPDHRRSGVGTALHDYGLEWAVGRGALVSRLMVEDWNTPARTQVSGAGYREVVKWISATRDRSTSYRPSDGNLLARASRAEVASAWITWSQSELARAARGFYSIGWYMRTMTAADVEQIALKARFYQSPSGWVEARVRDEDLWFPWIVTAEEDAPAMIEAILALSARFPEATGVRMMFPAVDWMMRPAESAGFELHPMSVFERPTPAS